MERISRLYSTILHLVPDLHVLKHLLKILIRLLRMHHRSQCLFNLCCNLQRSHKPSTSKQNKSEKQTAPHQRQFCPSVPNQKQPTHRTLCQPLATLLTSTQSFPRTPVTFSSTVPSCRMMYSISCNPLGCALLPLVRHSSAFHASAIARGGTVFLTLHVHRPTDLVARIATDDVNAYDIMVPSRRFLSSQVYSALGASAKALFVFMQGQFDCA